MDRDKADRGGLGRSEAALLVLALVLAAVLRLYDLGGLSLWHDELVASHPVRASVHNFAEILGRTALRDVHPPLYYCINLVWITLFGVSETSLRLLTALFGLATVPLVYLLGAELSSRRVGAWAALLMAALPFHVYHSRQVRMYSLLALLAAGSTLLFLRLARGGGRDGEPGRGSPNPSGGKWSFAGWLVVSCLMTTTHMYGMFVLGAQLLLVTLHGRRALPQIASWACVIALPSACYLPFLLFARDMLKEAGGNTMFGSNDPIYSDTLSFLFGSHPHLPVAYVAPAVALAIFGVVRRPRREGEPPILRQGLAAPPPVSPLARWVWLGAAALSALVAVGARVTSAKIGRAMMATGFTTPGQVQTFVLNLTIGSLGVAVACFLVGYRDRLAAMVARRWPAQSVSLGNPVGVPQTPPEGERPAFSLSLVACIMVGLPFAVALLAGVAGISIALPRSFIATSSFVVLLMAQGLVALPTWPRALLGAVALSCFVAISGRFGAVPGLRPDETTLRAWLVHEHYDWSPLRQMLPPDDRVPIVAQRIAVTDGIVFYGGGREVARMRLTGRKGALVVDQVRGGDGPQLFHAGDAFPDTRVQELYWIDAPVPPSYARTIHPEIRVRLQQEMEKSYTCREIGVIAVDGVHVHRCTAMQSAAAGVGG